MIPQTSEFKKKKDNRTLEQVAQRSCEVSAFGETLNLTGHSPEQIDLAPSKGFNQMVSRGLWFWFNYKRAHGAIQGY